MKSFIGILKRYSIATIGLFLVALGVALSIKSDLGTAPISCPPYVFSLWTGVTVGTCTAIMHFCFIMLQIILLRKRFKLEYLMQIAAAMVFGFLTDFTIWATGWIVTSAYIGKFALMMLAVLITAVGISIEVRCKAWMLAGEMTVVAIAEVGGWKFSNAKICFDIVLVLLAAVVSFFVFSNPFGSPDSVVIREGTLVLALFTGLAMKITDPVVDKIIGKTIDGSFGKVR